MAAPMGNQFWKQRSSHGRKPLWGDPKELKDACYQYLDWVHDNPLEEAISYQGEIMKKPMPKLRAMTVGGLCIYLGLTQETWNAYRSKEGFSLVTKEIDEIIRTQKFEGAAAGLLNQNIIARDLGLGDKQTLEHAGKIDYTNATEDELNQKLERLLIEAEKLSK